MVEMEDIEKYMECAEKETEDFINEFIDNSPKIKRIKARLWFYELVIVGILIWQFFIISKLKIVLDIIIQNQMSIASMNGEMLFPFLP